MVDLVKIIPHVTVFIGVVLCIISAIPAGFTYFFILLNGYFFILAFICCFASFLILFCSIASFAVGTIMHFTVAKGVSNLYLLIHAIIWGILFFICSCLGCLCFIPIYIIAIPMAIIMALWAIICFPCFPCIIALLIVFVCCLAYVPPSIPFIPSCLAGCAFFPHGIGHAGWNGWGLLQKVQGKEDD